MATPCVYLRETWPQEEVGQPPREVTAPGAVQCPLSAPRPPSPGLAPPGRAVSLRLPGHNAEDTWAHTCPSREPPSRREVAPALHPREESFPGSSQDNSVLPHGWPLPGTVPATGAAGPRAAGVWGLACAFSTQPCPGLGAPTPRIPPLSRPAVLPKKVSWRRQHPEGCR